ARLVAPVAVVVLAMLLTPMAGASGGTTPDQAAPTTTAGTATPAATCAPMYVDVPCDHLFFGEVRWLAEDGLAGGFPGGTFGPQRVTTRQEMAACLHRAAGRPTGPFPDPGSPDVPPTRPLHLPIAWLATTGLTATPTGADFHPTDPVTRQQ